MEIHAFINFKQVKKFKCFPLSKDSTGNFKLKTIKMHSYIVYTKYIVYTSPQITAYSIYRQIPKKNFGYLSIYNLKY